jgi:alcohol dehydrogenase (cytochrome c)
VTGILYQPQNNICMDLIGHTDEPTAEDGYATTRITTEDPTITQTPYPVGRIDAVSLETGEYAWLHEQRAGITSGVVATGGGLVFVADANRRFMALDDTTGEVLWESILSGPSTANPISYEIDGKQYIAIAAGGGGLGRPFALTPEFMVPQQLNTFFVFTLPD